MTRKKFDSSFKISQNLKEMLQSKSRASIDQIVHNQRQKFGHSTLPDIKEGYNTVDMPPGDDNDLYKEGSLTAMMLDPNMRDLRKTWMGGYYLNELKKVSNAVKVK